MLFSIYQHMFVLLEKKPVPWPILGFTIVI